MWLQHLGLQSPSRHCIYDRLCRRQPCCRCCRRCVTAARVVCCPRCRPPGGCRRGLLRRRQRGRRICHCSSYCLNLLPHVAVPKRRAQREERGVPPVSGIRALKPAGGSMKFPTHLHQAEAAEATQSNSSMVGIRALHRGEGTSGGGAGRQRQQGYRQHPRRPAQVCSRSRAGSCVCCCILWLGDRPPCAASSFCPSTNYQPM